MEIAKEATAIKATAARIKCLLIVVFVLCRNWQLVNAVRTAETSVANFQSVSYWWDYGF